MFYNVFTTVFGCTGIGGCSKGESNIFQPEWEGINSLGSPRNKFQLPQAGFEKAPLDSRVSKRSTLQYALINYRVNNYTHMSIL